MQLPQEGGTKLYHRLLTHFHRAKIPACLQRSDLSEVIWVEVTVNTSEGFNCGGQETAALLPQHEHWTSFSEDVCFQKLTGIKFHSV